MTDIGPNAMQEAIELVLRLQAEQPDDDDAAAADEQAFREARQHAARKQPGDIEELAQRYLGLRATAVNELRENIVGSTDAIDTFFSYVHTTALDQARATKDKLGDEPITIEEVGAYYGFIVCLIAQHIQEQATPR